MVIKDMNNEAASEEIIPLPNVSIFPSWSNPRVKRTD